MKTIRKYCLLILLVLLLVPIRLLADSYPDSLRAVRIHEDIEVDGDLEESAWETHERIVQFTQRELEEGQPATERTEVVVLYDDAGLYIGVWAFDSEPEKIIAKESKRDFNWRSEDNFEIILGPFNDNRNGYLFVVNPNGAMADVLVTDEGGGFNKDWNGVWEAAVEIDEDGWFIEMEIPFSTLKFPDSDEQVWALNMERNIRRKNEQVLWQGWSRDYDLETLSQAGRLVGLKSIQSTNRWEFKPYLNVGVEKEIDESPVDKIKFGGDINFTITPKMKLNVTLNTDFSQVEADREEINLTRFSLFYPEKREFFLEGKNLFEFGLGEGAHLFYSRRIGLYERKEVPIIGGARLVGKTGNTHIGLMSIQSAESGDLSSNNFSVIRLKQEVLGQSNVGLIVTSKNGGDEQNLVYGVDANFITSKFLGDKNLAMGLAISQSFDRDQTNNDNLGYRAYLRYPNDFAEFVIYTTKIEKNYNPEIGFLRRKDYQLVYSELEVSPRPKILPFIKNFVFVPFEVQYYYSNHNRELESVKMEFRPMGFELKSGDEFEFNIQRYYDRLDEDFEIIDDVDIPASEYWFTRYELGLESFEGRSLFGEMQYSWGEFYSGTRRETEMQLGYNISRKMKLSLDWEHNVIQLDDELFSTDEIGGWFEYGFNPNLNASLFGQWNDEDDEVILNYRLNWIPNAGSYFYFVVNQELSTEGGSMKLLNTTIIAKLIWRFSM